MPQGRIDWKILKAYNQKSHSRSGQMFSASFCKITLEDISSILPLPDITVDIHGKKRNAHEY